MDLSTPPPAGNEAARKRLTDPCAFKTLLVHVEASEASDARLRLAAGLAQTFDATLIGVGGQTPGYIAEPWLCSADGGAAQIVQDRDAAALEAAETQFRLHSGGLPKGAVWRAVRDDPSRSLPTAAAAADLILAGRGASSSPGEARAGDLVMHAGVPVLSTPSGLARLDATTVVVAWKNTPEARRAVSDAMPFLHRADDVLIVEVADEAARDVASLNDVRERLLRHGIRARAQTLSSGTAGAGPTLVAFVEALGCQLVVSGAYGHSRAREWVFGGVTQHLLEQCTMPVLFSR